MFLLLPALMYIFHVFPFSIVLDIYLGIHQFLQTMEIFTFVQFQEMTNFLNLFKKKILIPDLAILLGSLHELASLAKIQRSWTFSIPF